MRILFVSPVGALFSGAEVSILNLMEYLSKSGHQVYNVIPDNEDNADLTYLNRMEDAGIKFYSLRSPCWWWIESKKVLSTDKNTAILYQQKNIADIRNIIREEKIELVISNTVNVFQGAIAAALENCRHYYFIHEFPVGEFEYFKDKIPLINSLSDKIFTVQGGLYKELLNYFSEDKLSTFVPYSHIGEKALKKGEKTRIVSIGGVSEWKNQLELIKAFELLQSTDLELIFIGGWNSDYKAICDNYIRENSIENVQFLGYQENPWSFVADRDIVVLPSKVESFSLVLVETIFHRLPFIVSDNWGHRTVGTFFGFDRFYKVGEIEELASKIKDCIDNYRYFYEESMWLSQVAGEVYTPSIAYKNFLNELNSSASPFSEKSIRGLTNLLGIPLSNDILHYIENEKVTLFFANEKDEHFTILDSEIFSLEANGKIQIVPKSGSKVRIDLTENPGIFKNVNLISNKTGEIIPVHFTNGIHMDDYFIFYTSDPQLIFDISQFKNDTLTFSYTCLSDEKAWEVVNNILRAEERQSDSLRIEIVSLLDSRQELQSNYEKLQEDYEDLLHTYHSVIGSRRWIIPTKIINFFRRNK